MQDQKILLIFYKNYYIIYIERKKMLQNYKGYLINLKEDIEERIEALDNDSYITGFHDNVNLSMTSEIKNDFDECRYGDFFIQEVEVI